MKVLSIVMALVVATISAPEASATDWSVVYETDFSSDPGWITNSGDNYYWHESSLSYYFKNAVDDDDADLIYNWTTGNVVLDPAEAGRIISVLLQNDPGGLEFNEAEFKPPFPNPVYDATPTQIAHTDFTFVGITAPHDAGDIFPLGMDTPELLADFLTTAGYASSLGVGGAFDLVIVPEPSSAALVLLGVAGIVRRARRKR